MLSTRGLSRSLIKGLGSSASATLISSSTCSVIRFSRPTFVTGGGMGIHGFVRGFGQRAMASDAKGEKISEKNMKDMRKDTKKELLAFLRQEILDEQESTPGELDLDPPAGWSTVDTAGYLSGNDDILVMMEKKVGNELISVITSIEVVDTSDSDMEDEMETDEADQDSDSPDKGGISALMLIAIKKPSGEQPLYLECMFDRFGVQITRAHVGLGYTGFMSEQNSAATLYHTYISHMEAMSEQEGEELSHGRATGLDTTEARSATSPPFHDLDDQLQALFEKMLVEWSIDAELCDHMMNALYIKEQNSYVKFLSKLEQWIGA